MSVASLPMYDAFVPYESSTAIWNAIKGDAVGYPSSLDLFSSCYTVWTSGPELTLTQACGYPLVREYSGHLQVVGTPIYAAPGCSGTTYRSALIVSSDSNIHTLDQLLSTRESLVLGVNSFGSFSGWLALLSALSDSYSHLRSRDAAAPLTTISNTVLTGSHIGSIKAVQIGMADLACIDGVSLELARTHCPLLLEGIRIIGWGLPAPALPFATDINASADKVAALRQGLVNMIQSTNKDIVIARQKHLLVGVDVSGDVDYATYESSVNQHIALARATPETAALFDSLLAGKPPRESYTVQSPQRPLRVDLQCKLEDASWPTADFSMLQGLRRYLARYLWDTLHAACVTIGGKNDFAVKSRHSRIEEELTVQVLMGALIPIVGQQLWPVLPDGGKPKLIFCSLRGTLLLLKAMSPTKAQYVTVRPAVYNSTVDDVLSHPTWTKIAAVARAALAHVDEASSQLGQPRTTPDTEEDPYWAGFCGAGAASLTEYFPEPAVDGAEAPAGEKKDATAETISKLWAADINLSHHLIRTSAKGTNGMIAYISAPRHNDRGDWANLVLTEDEAAIERWRDSRGHSSVRKHVAPWSYDHIRLHRGILQGGLAGEQLVLKRTVFLGPVDKPITAEPPKVDDSLLPEMDVYETELSTLRIAQPPAAPESGGCPAGAMGKGLERSVVYWADLAPHKGGAGTTSAEAVLQGGKVVPGGVHVTLSEFKAQLLNDSSAPFVTVDESLITPK